MCLSQYIYLSGLFLLFGVFWVFAARDGSCTCAFEWRAMFTVCPCVGRVRASPSYAGCSCLECQLAVSPDARAAPRHDQGAGAPNGNNNEIFVVESSTIRCAAVHSEAGQAIGYAGASDRYTPQMTTRAADQISPMDTTMNQPCPPKLGSDIVADTLGQ